MVQWPWRKARDADLQHPSKTAPFQAPTLTASSGNSLHYRKASVTRAFYWMEWKLSSMSPWFKGCPLEKLGVVSFFYSFLFAATGKLLLCQPCHTQNSLYQTRIPTNYTRSFTTLPPTSTCSSNSHSSLSVVPRTRHSTLDVIWRAEPTGKGNSLQFTVAYFWTKNQGRRSTR